jgi:hypothetical protein
MVVGVLSVEDVEDRHFTQRRRRLQPYQVELPLFAERRYSLAGGVEHRVGEAAFELQV